MAVTAKRRTTKGTPRAASRPGPRQAAPPRGDDAAAVAPPTARVSSEWRARIAAEYGSAAITQHFVHWLIQIGASPDLLHAGLRIVRDELAHARLSNVVYRASGGHEAPVLDRKNLELVRRGDVPLELDVLRTTVRVFCLGETVAVPLFSHLRAECTVPPARAALDRVLRDEVRHRDFGWTTLDWLLTTPLGPRVPAIVGAELPGMFRDLERLYGALNPVQREEAYTVSKAERAWGLASPSDYARILHRAFERDFEPRFRARGVDAAAAWAKRLEPPPTRPAQGGEAPRASTSTGRVAPS